MITDEQIKQGLDKSYKEAGKYFYYDFGDGFKAGVKFALEQVKKCSIPDVSKRVFIVEILEKEKGWNAISVNLETYEQAFSFFDSHRKDYSHGEIRIVQVHVC